MRLYTFLITLWLLLGLTQCAQPDGEGVDLPATWPTNTPTPEIGVILVTMAPSTAVLIQTTPTPLPTPTPTATSTPIIYLIEAGDTLLGIAIARRTTVEEIVALNPGIRPESLQIGQSVELPPPATPIAQTAVGTPIPIQVVVKGVSLYQTPVGSLWLLGEVINQGSHDVENVQVQISLVDAAGAPLTTVRAWPMPAVIAAGETAPFGVLINEPPAHYSHTAAAVIAGQTVYDLGSRYLDLAVEETAINIDDNLVTLSGQLQNSGEETAVQISLVATLYNVQGEVTGYQEWLLPGPLAPGETISFEFEIAPPGGRSVDFYLSTQSLKH